MSNNNKKRGLESRYSVIPDGATGIVVIPELLPSSEVSDESDSEEIIQSLSSKKPRYNTHGNLVDIRKAVEKEKRIPDPKIDANPTEFLIDLIESLHGYRPKVAKAMLLKDYFSDVTEDRIASYDLAAVTAARTNNLEALKNLEAAGKRMDCCNRFGESLLHMACRRGFTNIGNYLLNDAKLSVRISDDCGRNPFHDICWNPKASTEIAKTILQIDSTLLLVGDKRGHTPFDYARREHWKIWRDLLYSNQDSLHHFSRHDNKALFYHIQDSEVKISG